MRSVFLACSAMLLLTSSSTAFAFMHGGQQRYGAAAAAAAPPTPASPLEQSWAAGYRLLDVLCVALRPTQPDFSYVTSLLAEDGNFQGTDVGCGPLSRSYLVSLWQDAPVLGRWFNLLSWVGLEDGSSLVEVAFTRQLNTSAGVAAKTTFYVPSYFCLVKPNAAGTQLEVLRMFVSPGPQANSSAMTQVWDHLREALVLGDVATFNTTLAPSFTSTGYSAWGQHTRSVVNRAQFLTSLGEGFKAFSQREVWQRSSFAACNVVFADIIQSFVAPTVSSVVRSVIMLELTPEYQVSQSTSFAMTVDV